MPYHLLVHRADKIIPSSLEPGKKALLCLAGYLIYASLFLLIELRGGIATNYLIILPIIISSYLFGLWGGVISGTMGLPCNLLLFYMRDALNYAPYNLYVAQISGIVIGTGLGLAGAYFDRTGKEIEQRKLREEELRIALEEREILYKELNHRVKNNLNIMKSLIQLQMNRTKNDDFRQEGKKLVNRILSISLVHEQLYSGQLNNKLNLRKYLSELAERILAGHGGAKINLSVPQEKVPLTIPLEKALPVGIIINEIITNSIKYAFEEEPVNTPRIELRALNFHGGIRVEAEDNGKGFLPGNIHTGLGTTLIQTLTRQLHGEYSYLPNDRGTLFALTFPM